MSCGPWAIANSRPGRAIRPSDLRISSFLKRVPCPSGANPHRPPKRHAHRAVVARRRPDWPTDQANPPLGAARNPTNSAQRPAPGIGMDLWRHLPRRGQSAALVMPRCNSDAMGMHLAEISSQVVPGAHAVLMLDQAGWHMSGTLEVPANITLLPLPPKCPELNPVENVWQFMRDNWLSNRIFSSYDDIVDHCCFAWNRLTDQPWRIMRLGLRTWAHRS